MERGFFLVTGTSRGIGEALSQSLLAENHVVLGAARTRSTQLKSPQYHHIACDLNELSSVDSLVEQASALVDEGSYDFLCLVNNAAMLEPLGAIEACKSDAIEAHMLVGLVAPMVLTSKFIRAFKDHSCRKKIVFISSGAAVRAMPGASAYCSSKAGLTMFARCVGLEQADTENGFEVMSLSPGMVETAMQQTARSKTTEEYAMAEFFRDAFESGIVQERAAVAERLVKVLKDHQQPGEFLSSLDQA
jgi:benzil reductase ((S)-benzoin forming)